MCILPKLHYAKFYVSGLFLDLNVIEEKPLGVGSTPPPPPPLVNEGLRQYDLLEQ